MKWLKKKMVYFIANLNWLLNEKSATPFAEKKTDDEGGSVQF